VENNKGTLQGGATQTIILRLKQAEPDAFIGNIMAFQGVGQWIEARGELKLSGGYVPPGAEDAILVLVKLKAYIEKI
jgi:hypothetical protein